MIKQNRYDERTRKSILMQQMGTTSEYALNIVKFKVDQQYCRDVLKLLEQPEKRIRILKEEQDNSIELLKKNFSHTTAILSMKSATETINDTLSKILQLKKEHESIIEKDQLIIETYESFLKEISSWFIFIVEEQENLRSRLIAEPEEPFNSHNIGIAIEALEFFEYFFEFSNHFRGMTALIYISPDLGKRMYLKDILGSEIANFISNYYEVKGNFEELRYFGEWFRQVNVNQMVSFEEIRSCFSFDYRLLDEKDFPKKSVSDVWGRKGISKDVLSVVNEAKDLWVSYKGRD